jgi:hypothetical protein
MIVRIAIAATCALASASCATAEQIPVRGETPGYTCNNANIQQFVGPAGDGRARSAEMLRVSGAGTLRWVPHGDGNHDGVPGRPADGFLDTANRVERLELQLTGQPSIMPASISACLIVGRLSRALSAIA